MLLLLRLISSVFQSTLPHGSDFYFGRPLVGQTISIHAPSRERPIRALAAIANVYFNPRSLTGATLILILKGSQRAFQSTLPHGSDNDRNSLLQCLALFQSTLPHGSDVILMIRLVYFPQFQSTLPHGSDIVHADRDKIKN